MRAKCLVPDCGGIIDSPNPSATPCPDCTKRVQVVPRLQEQIRVLQGQVLQFQARSLNAYGPLLQAIRKKPTTTKELAGAVKQAATSVATALLKLEKRGLVVVAEFRRLNGRAVGTPIWQLSALGERVLQESGGGGATK